MDSEFDQLGDLLTAARRELIAPLSEEVMSNLEQFQRELAALHDRRVQIINRQAEIEQSILRSALAGRRSSP